jgi:hypothetical protein
MEHQVTVRYDEQIINAAAKNLWFKAISHNVLIGFLIMLVGLALWFLLDSKTWLTATLISLSAVLIMMTIAMFFVFRGRSLKIYRQMESPTALWTFTEEGFSSKSDVGGSEYKWRIVKKLYKFKTCWLLMYVNRTYSILPLADIPENVREFIEQQVLANGGKIQAS